MKRFAIASDHAGLDLKIAVLNYFGVSGISIKDFGPRTKDSCDYPDFGKLVAEFVSQNPEEHVGILICGTGIGMSMVANRHSNVRAALCHSEYDAMMTRRHNDANVLCIGSRTTTAELAIAYVKEFLYHGFDGGRHEERVNKIELDSVDPVKKDRAFDRTC